MMDKNGGPAFPTKGVQVDSFVWLPASRGMSLRDYFAGQALAAQDVDSSTPDQIAKWSYAIADAMLEARNVR